MIICPCCSAALGDVAMPEEEHKIRDDEMVLYKRPESSRWQARYKLPDGKWHHVSTKRTSLVEAKRIAGEIYDEARFKHKLGHVVVSRRFRDVANEAIKLLDEANQAGRGKAIYRDYKQVLEKYFIPYFGSKHIDKLTDADLSQFDTWRTEKMKKAPAASTLLNHNAALKKVYDVALGNGWVNQAQIPTLKIKGDKSQRRPDFSWEDWRKLTNNLHHWVKKATHERSKQIREVLWDYVMVLANTGMRTGTEAMNLKWNQIRWNADQNGQKYLLLSVKGKTGKRDLVARSGTETYLMRSQARFPELAAMTFDELLQAKLDKPVFRMRNGKVPYDFGGVFEEFLTHAGILHDQHGDKRTLYSLRHMYATARLVVDKVSIHTLAVQMGTSVGMIEKHYSHLTAQMAADVLAGPRHDPEKAAAARAKKQIKDANVVAQPEKKASKKSKSAVTA